MTVLKPFGGNTFFAEYATLAEIQAVSRAESHHRAMLDTREMWKEIDREATRVFNKLNGMHDKWEHLKITRSNILKKVLARQGKGEKKAAEEGKKKKADNKKVSKALVSASPRKASPRSPGLSTLLGSDSESIFTPMKKASPVKTPKSKAL